MTNQRVSLHYVTRHHKVMLALQVALLGEITPKMRAVAVEYDDTILHFRVYLDGPITADDTETVSSIESGLLALFPPEHEISGEWIHLEFPQPIPKEHPIAYQRKEDLVELVTEDLQAELRADF